MRFKEKNLRFFVAILGGLLAVFLFYCTVFIYIVALQLYLLGIVDMLSMVVGTVSLVGFFVSLYVTIELLKTKISRETYFFVLIVAVFAVSSHLMLNFVLNIDFPFQWIVTFSIIVGTLVSCVFAGYSRRTIWKKLRRLGLTQGITLMTIFLLASIPVIEVLRKQTTALVLSTGQISYENIVFENGNDITKVQAQINNSVFRAEIPINSDTLLVARQIVNVTNRSPNSLDLKVSLEDFGGNLSEVKLLKVFLTFRNGSEIYPFNMTNGNVKYEQVHLSMKGYVTIAIGVISLGQEGSPIKIIFMCLLRRFNENDLSMIISLDSH